jgi:hypothetical protein
VFGLDLEKCKGRREFLNYEEKGESLDVDARAEEKGGVLEVFEETEGVREKMGEKKGVLKVYEEK